MKEHYVLILTEGEWEMVVGGLRDLAGFQPSGVLGKLLGSPSGDATMLLDVAHSQYFESAEDMRKSEPTQDFAKRLREHWKL